MKRFVMAGAAGLMLLASAPASAQAEDTAAGEDLTGEQLAEFGALMGQVFQTEPLTATQEARLPQARALVETMMPDGFYGQMMGDVMDKMMRPMMTMFSTPDFILAARLSLEDGALDDLEESEKAELLEMLDPAHDRRVDAIINVLTGQMAGMFEVMEDPMRDGLSKAYAVRFDQDQLADIGAFFATPTGEIYAREQMALFADPQVMQASMQALPAMMSGFGDMEATMKEAMASLPKERSYEDLDTAQRRRMAQLLGLDVDSLAEVVLPPKPVESEGVDAGM
ncbi:DUF2059 domain-containing protein [Qipengyuania sp. XHP0207]|uniref:DUF2059 domain-containing protein n=1 Tax=Qipengyuania sp. XHP0207 TaxID=3038078 RepID=UPI002420228F|nr:DUF2059 domain-containing protein [Qipengyuania sp. XHP0207]MDG5748190.1 DUF2059 domain-containing protein [Qipengyuania sp. XHP0207]